MKMMMRKAAEGVSHGRPRLYLSSHQLGDDAELLRWPAGEAVAARHGRCGIVMNALDGFVDTRLRDFDDHVGAMECLGYGCEELDLRRYFHAGDEAGLARRLAQLDLLWITGGNAFVLARAMDQSRFAAALAPALAAGTLTYAGYSAAACVAGPDLHGIDLMDEPEVVPEGYDPSSRPLGLGLVDYRIVPHWRSDHRESELAKVAAAWMEREGLAHRCISDGEVVVVP